MNKIGQVNGNTRGVHFARAWRAVLNVSQERIASRMAELLNRSFDRSQLSKIEKGSVALTEQTQAALAEALGIEIGALFVEPSIYRRRSERLKKIEDMTDDELDAAMDMIRKIRRS